MAEMRYPFGEHATCYVLRAQARRIREGLRASTTPGDRIVLDFTGVEAVTNAFVDELVGKLITASDRRVIIEGANEEVRDAIATVLTRRG